MKKLFFVFFFLPAFFFSQNPLPYTVGEYTEFDISFRGIRMGSAELSIESIKEIEGISTFHIVGKGKTSKLFDWFFKVRDIYETYLDTTLILPVTFFRDVDEGGYKINQRYFFRHSESLVFVEDTSYTIEKRSQDMLSAFFYARTFRESILNKKNRFLFLFLWMKKIIYWRYYTFIMKQ